jgi:hypothetical protein
VPPVHGIRPNDEQRISPLEASCQDGQTDSGRRIHTPRLDSALLEQCQLSAKKQILGLDRPRRPEEKNEEPGSVREELESDLDERNHALIMP